MKVRRPEVGPKDFDRGYETPDFKVWEGAIDYFYECYTLFTVEADRSALKSLLSVEHYFLPFYPSNLLSDILISFPVSKWSVCSYAKRYLDSCR